MLTKRKLFSEIKKTIDTSDKKAVKAYNSLVRLSFSVIKSNTRFITDTADSAKKLGLSMKPDRVESVNLYLGNGELPKSVSLINGTTKFTENPEEKYSLDFIKIGPKINKVKVGSLGEWLKPASIKVNGNVIPIIVAYSSSGRPSFIVNTDYLSDIEKEFDIKFLVSDLGGLPKYMFKYIKSIGEEPNKEYFQSQYNEIR